MTDDDLDRNFDRTFLWAARFVMSIIAMVPAVAVALVWPDSAFGAGVGGATLYWVVFSPAIDQTECARRVMGRAGKPR